MSAWFYVWCGTVVVFISIHYAAYRLWAKERNDVVRLEEALKRYGEHDLGCMKYAVSDFNAPGCTCGFDPAVRGEHP